MKPELVERERRQLKDFLHFSLPEGLLIAGLLYLLRLNVVVIGQPIADNRVIIFVISPHTSHLDMLTTARGLLAEGLANLYAYTKGSHWKSLHNQLTLYLLFNGQYFLTSDKPGESVEMVVQEAQKTSKPFRVGIFTQGTRSKNNGTYHSGAIAIAKELQNLGVDVVVQPIIIQNMLLSTLDQGTVSSNQVVKLLRGVVSRALRGKQTISLEILDQLEPDIILKIVSAENSADRSSLIEAYTTHNIGAHG